MATPEPEEQVPYQAETPVLAQGREMTNKHQQEDERVAQRAAQLPYGPSTGRKYSSKGPSIQLATIT